MNFQVYDLLLLDGWLDPTCYASPLYLVIEKQPKLVSLMMLTDKPIMETLTY